MTESLVLCEGFHDRAFWQGWLLHLGCRDPGATTSRRRSIIDPWGDPVGGGDFAFESPNKRFIRVRPVMGKSQMRGRVWERIRQASTRALEHLVVNVDADVDRAVANQATRQSIESAVQQQDSTATFDKRGDSWLNDGTTRVSLAIWSVEQPEAPGVPQLQTLERVACAALAAAYPQRAEAVQAWLDGRPDPPKANAKAFAWSYMAGWAAELGCDAFYSHLWQDAAAAAELERLLKAIDVWRIAADLTG